MTLSLTHRILFSALAACATTAYAGSPDGLSLAAVGNASGAPYAAAVERFMADHKAGKVADCNDFMLNVANLYVTHLPPQLTGDLAVAAASDKARRKRLGKLLTGFRDATLTHGFDGVLAYEVKGGKLRLYGISGDPDEKVLVSTLAPADAADQNKFNVAACKAVAGLGVLAAP
jgi:hypothetical protein